MRTNTREILDRLRPRVHGYAPGSEAINQALTLIGNNIANKTKLNIRRQGLVDLGALLNSIQFRLFKDAGRMGVIVGSFGIPYAAVHEFGFRGTVQVRSHIRQTLGGAVEVSAHSRRMNIRKREYLRPAFESEAGQIAKLLRDTVGK